MPTCISRKMTQVTSSGSQLRRLFFPLICDRIEEIDAMENAPKRQNVSYTKTNSVMFVLLLLVV